MPRDESDVTGSISPILPNMEMRIVDENWNDVEPGEPGEVLVRGPLVTQGYYDNPTAAKESFHGGWFCTGDIVVDRGGKIHIVDRKKGLTKYKVLQTTPAEVKNALITHPKIQEVAIVRLPIPGGFEILRAYIVADPAHATKEEIQEYISRRTAAYKQLRGGIVYVHELPKKCSWQTPEKRVERAR